jgi:hypothetical protein
MEQQETAERTIKIKSPTRFALVGPGLPTPSIIIASSDDVSDLAGYYSIREAGFSDVMDFGPTSRGTILDRLLRVPIDSEKMGRRYGAVDVWIKGKERNELYSLIFDQGQFQYSAASIIDEFADKLRNQITRVVEAYSRNDMAEVQYVGQMLSTFMSLVLDRIAYRRRRQQRREKLLASLMIVYIVIGVLGTAIVISAKFFVH